MSETELALNKVPKKCRASLETYGFLVYSSVQNEKEKAREEYDYKLLAYLKCLFDMGILKNLGEIRLIRAWLIAGHVFPGSEEEKGEYDDLLCN